MKPFQIIGGIVLFAMSTFVADIAVTYGFSMTFGGTDYASTIISKVLDVLAGSLIVWGILDFNKRGRR